MRRWAETVEHAFAGIAKQAKVSRVFVKAERQCGTKALFEVEDFARDDFDGCIPGDALPVAGAASVLDHGIEKPVFVIDGGEDLIALGAELAVGAGGQVVAGYVVDSPVTRIGEHGAGVVAVARTHVPGDGISLPVQ